MKNIPEVTVSAFDAAEVGSLLENVTRDGGEVQAATALANVLDECRVVPADELSKDVVALGSAITYAEAASGTRHTVRLALPPHSDPGAGRVSVLSPVGCALLGRRIGSDVDVMLPGGRRLPVRILEVSPQRGVARGR